MRLLVCTQAVDKNDPVLGFFHQWLLQFAGDFEEISVLCLRVGEHDLPKNVLVYPLGRTRLGRIARILRHSISLKSRYQSVFVHMSEEYVLTGGWLWKLLRKRVYLWRNHYQGSILTDIAGVFCTKIFYTSAYSYTATYKKSVRMPVGVDLSLFKPASEGGRRPDSVLFLGRIAPSKRPEILLQALRLAGGDVRATFCGPGERSYLESLRHQAEKLGLLERVRFIPPVRNAEAPGLYSQHQIFVNCSPSGMFDKTLFEAAACQCLVLAASKDWAALLGKEPVEGPIALADALKRALSLSEVQRAARQEKQAAIVIKHSLASLSSRLKEEMTS